MQMQHEVPWQNEVIGDHERSALFGHGDLVLADRGVEAQAIDDHKELLALQFIFKRFG